MLSYHNPIPDKRLVNFTYAIDMTLALLTDVVFSHRIKLEFHLYLIGALFEKMLYNKIR